VISPGPRIFSRLGCLDFVSADDGCETAGGRSDKGRLSHETARVEAYKLEGTANRDFPIGGSSGSWPRAIRTIASAIASGERM
jgi:hypothetical protein